MSRRKSAASARTSINPVAPPRLPADSARAIAQACEAAGADVPAHIQAQLEPAPPPAAKAEAPANPPPAAPAPTAKDA